jgi:putative ABC transport system permease protein
VKYFPLIWAGLWRKPLRSILTLLSITVAFVLFGMLHGVIAGFESGIDQMSETRLRVQSRAGILTGVPLAHLTQIEQVDGVAGVGYFAIFLSYYKEQLNPVGAGAKYCPAHVCGDQCGRGNHGAWRTLWCVKYDVQRS